MKFPTERHDAPVVVGIDVCAAAMRFRLARADWAV